MAKKSGIGNLILIGGLALGGYLLYKMLSGNQTGTSGYSSGWIPGDTTPGTPMNGDSNLPGDTTPKTPTVYKTKEPVVYNNNGNIIVEPIITEPLIMKPNIVYTLPTGNTITIPAPLGVAETTLAQPKATGWTGGTYGQQGQPSVSFLQRTLTTPQPKAVIGAIGAGAPPRIVAKFKAGKVY